MSAEERLAVLESKLDRNEKDITKLFDFIRAHMDREERDRADFLDQLTAIKTTINTQKSFVGGMIFAVTSLWAVITFAAYWMLKSKGG